MREFKWEKIGSRSWRLSRGHLSLTLRKDKEGKTSVEDPQTDRLVVGGADWETAKKLAMEMLRCISESRV